MTVSHMGSGGVCVCGVRVRHTEQRGRCFMNGAAPFEGMRDQIRSNFSINN